MKHVPCGKRVHASLMRLSIPFAARRSCTVRSASSLFGTTKKPEDTGAQPLPTGTSHGRARYNISASSKRRYIASSSFPDPCTRARPTAPAGGFSNSAGFSNPARVFPERCGAMSHVHPRAGSESFAASILFGPRPAAAARTAVGTPLS